ncbi:MAG: heme A synthase [Ponticaulis sp.]|nr:heme A synthase [Ponticaulis sp.]|tara:strand:+ start:45806 stop:46891 length:1086 start_codon:yes stop_codon:yes gene_type:complete
MTDTTQQKDDSLSPQARRWIRSWLSLLGFMVYAMILVGGATRLTDSGLSITEWKPISGALPPFGQDDWMELFRLYQQTEEYRVQNAGMTLAEFEFIYWWEWGHRFLGRVIGLVAIVGFVIFAMKKWLNRQRVIRFGVLIFLGGLQGAIGWWMVASGIGETDLIDVAAYRLMTHFCLAVLIIGLIVWFWLDLVDEKTDFQRKALSPVLTVFTVMVFIQLATGALVAGLDAGRTYTDWPMMDGEFVPVGYWESALGFRNLFENVATTQFNHRLLAYIIALYAVFVGYYYRQDWFRPGLRVLLGSVLLQMFWGVFTLVSAAPLELALIHQGIGVIILIAAIRSLHRDCYSAAGDNLLNRSRRST